MDVRKLRSFEKVIIFSKNLKRIFSKSENSWTLQLFENGVHKGSGAFMSEKEYEKNLGRNLFRFRKIQKIECRFSENITENGEKFVRVRKTAILGKENG